MNRRIKMEDFVKRIIDEQKEVEQFYDKTNDRKTSCYHLLANKVM